MTGGRERGGIRRGVWLHRADRHQSEQSAPAPDVTGASGAAGADRDAGESVGGGGGEPAAPETQASLDQVLRKADVARKAERDPRG